VSSVSGANETCCGVTKHHPPLEELGWLVKTTTSKHVNQSSSRSAVKPIHCYRTREALLKDRLGSARVRRLGRLLPMPAVSRQESAMQNSPSMNREDATSERPRLHHHCYRSSRRFLRRFHCAVREIRPPLIAHRKRLLEMAPARLAPQTVTRRVCWLTVRGDRPSDLPGAGCVQHVL
jgi:hypothetical protein